MEDFKEQINLYPLHPFLVFTSKSFSPYNDQISNASKNLKHLLVFRFMLLSPDQNKMSVLLSVHLNLLFALTFDS